jgi:hypothetical protein
MTDDEQLRVSIRQRLAVLEDGERINMQVFVKDVYKLLTAPVDQDAARYRWLRAYNSGPIGILAFNSVPDLSDVLTEEDADAAIDAARYRALFTIQDFCRDPLWPVVAWMRDGHDIDKAEIDAALDAAIDAASK